jgi:tetratricopeptide (TPR) repeat protein
MNPLAAVTPGERYLGVFTVLGHYVRLLLVPARLSCDYGLAIVDPRAGVVPHTLLGMAAAAAWLVGLAGYRRSGGAWRLTAVLCATTLASYVLISNAVVLIGVSLAERLLYWPSVHVFMLMAVGVVVFGDRYCVTGKPLAARARLLGLLGAAVILALSMRTALRNLDWADNFTLMSQDVRTWPQGVQLNKNMAVELLQLAAHTDDPEVRHEQLLGADAFLARALEIHPSHATTLGLRAITRAELGDRVGAEGNARGALLLNPHNEEALSVLARLEAAAVPGDEALESLCSVASSQPANAAAQMEAGQALFNAGRAALARPYLERAVALRPDDVEALKLYGHTLALLRRESEALELLRRALALDPSDSDIHANLSWLLARRGAFDEAVRHAERARELQPDDLRIQINLAEAYLLGERRADALALLRLVLSRVDPAQPMRAIIAARIEEIERGR